MKKEKKKQTAPHLNDKLVPAGDISTIKVRLCKLLI